MVYPEGPENMENRAELQTVKRPIATKLLRVVFSMYFVIAFLVTAGHLLLEYTRIEDDTLTNLGLIHQTFNPAIANSAWNLDERQLHTTLSGILALPMMSGARFIPADARKEIALGTTTTSLWRSFPVTYHPGDGSSAIAVGTLTLHTERAELLAEIQYSFYIIVLNSLIKTLALYALFRWAGMRLLSRPLARFAHGLNKLDFSGGAKNEPIAFKGAADDELGMLGTAFNKMIHRLNIATEENRRLHGDLSDLNKDLERRVRVRTMQLHDAQRKLLKAAHAAGVSQVTSEILHNVGNIVNSIVLAINDMRDNLADDQFNKLMKVIEVLEDKIKRQDLDGMDRIIEYISLFSAKTKEDIDSVRQVLEGLQRFVVHLRHITETQKTNLVDTPYESEVVIETLIDDSIHLAGLKNNPDIDVMVEREGTSLPAVLSDEHKLLQVFVNLLLNARQAVMESKRSQKVIRIKLGVSRPMFGGGTGSLEVSIEDNGIGIGKDNLARIFQSGFTTKAAGSGLGLHNSANNVKTIGGEIECHSAGSMMGAVFKVRLPLKTVKKAG